MKLAVLLRSIANTHYFKDNELFSRRNVDNKYEIGNKEEQIQTHKTAHKRIQTYSRTHPQNQEAAC